MRERDNFDYSAYGLNPEEDLSLEKSMARRQLNLIKYHKITNGRFNPYVISNCPIVFTDEERKEMEKSKRSTMRGNWHREYYVSVAYRGEWFPYIWNDEPKYYPFIPIVNRVLRDKKRKIRYGEMDEYNVTSHGLKIAVVENKIIDKIGRKYNLVSRSLDCLRNHEYAEYRLRDRKETADELRKARSERRKCEMCGAFHVNKEKMGYYRFSSNKIHVFALQTSAHVQPYCSSCGVAYIKRIAKEEYKAEKALKEAREVNKLLRSIKQEIKQYEQAN